MVNREIRTILTPAIEWSSTGLLTMEAPGDGDDPGEGRDESQDDWSDIDDEDFEDMAEDDDDLHEIESENDIFDPEDDDHMPDGDDL